MLICCSDCADHYGLGLITSMFGTERPQEKVNSCTTSRCVLHVCPVPPTPWLCSAPFDHASHYFGLHNRLENVHCWYSRPFISCVTIHAMILRLGYVVSDQFSNVMEVFVVSPLLCRPWEVLRKTRAKLSHTRSSRAESLLTDTY